MENSPNTRSLFQPTWIIAIAVLIFVVLIGYRFFSSPSDSPPVTAGPVDLGPAPARGSADAHQPQNRVMQSVEAERLALAKARLIKLSQIADEIRDLILDLENEIAIWQNEVEPLLTNESGKLLAAGDVTLQAFRQIYAEGKRASPKTPERLRTLLQNYIAPIKQALADPSRSYSPSEELEVQLGELRTSAERAIESYKEPRRQIQSMVSSAVKSGTEPASQTLGQAVDSLAERHALDQAQAVAAAIEAERKLADQKLAELEAENARKKAERKLAQKKLEDELREKEAERELARMKAEEESKAAQAKIDEIKKRAADPTVQAKYKPFLEKGRFGFRTVQTPPHRTAPLYDLPQPASLKRLRELGVLANPAVFWKTGAAHKSDGNRDKYGYYGQGYSNDRPAWSGRPYPPRTEEEAKDIVKLYEEFNELAPIWVEMGLLKP